jgi:hypothetical protein
MNEARVSRPGLFCLCATALNLAKAGTPLLDRLDQRTFLSAIEAARAAGIVSPLNDRSRALYAESTASETAART